MRVLAWIISVAAVIVTGLLLWKFVLSPALYAFHGSKVQVDDVECEKAEPGMKMLKKPPGAIRRARNPNTGICAWEY